MFTDLKEREKGEGGRERETDRQTDINQLPPPCPDLGLNPQPFGAQDDCPTN